MNFDDFRIDIESKLRSIKGFELIEYQYMPYLFGSGLIAYRIESYYHKFVFDGRENHLTWFKGQKSHEKYFEVEFKEVKKFERLVSANELLKEIK